MEKIIVGVNVHKKLINAQRRCSWRAFLYLLGKNKYGVCSIATRLRATTAHGCGFMPGIETDELTKMVLSFSRRGLSIGGFAYVSKNEYPEPSWGGDAGDDIWAHPEVPFLSFTGHKVLAQVSDKYGDIHHISVCIVDKDFGKPVPTKRKKTVVKRTKSIKRSKK